MNDYIRVMDISCGDIVEVFDSQEEAEQWIERSEFPELYQIIEEKEWSVNYAIIRLLIN